MKIKIPLRLRKLRIFINKKICKIQKNKIWIKNNSISRRKKKGKEVFLKKLKKMEIKQWNKMIKNNSTKLLIEEGEMMEIKNINQMKNLRKKEIRIMKNHKKEINEL